jgi:hypothetical protein
MHKRLAAVLVVLIALGTACHAAEWVDPFEEVLEPGWRWIRESSSNWSLTERDGHLRITTQMGGLLLGSDSARNLLLRDAPDGDFEIETLVYFEPVSDFQIAGLLVYEDDGNFLLLGRGYCDSCGGNKIYFDYEEDGEPLGGDRLATSDPNRAYLRIVKRGSTYSGYYSENGAEWTLVGEYPGVGIRPQGVGLATTGDADPRGTRVAADFAFFSLEEEEVAAAPATAPATAPPSTGDTHESVGPVLPSTTDTDEPVGPVYASRVLQCSNCTKGSSPEWVLGPPCDAAGAPRIDMMAKMLNWRGCWVGLGKNGRLVVEMERPFTDGPGADLYVYEFLGNRESDPRWFADFFSVYVSADGENWIQLGSNVAAEEGGPPIGYAAFDLKTHPGTYRFVKVAVTMLPEGDPFSDNPHLGTEVLAIEALYPASE